MIQTENFAQVEVTSPNELYQWLDANHQQPESIWLVTYKKSVPEKYVANQVVLDELIAFGWIDGIKRKLDDERTLQLIAPRKMQAWARTYQERAARLEAEGRMQPAGRQSIEDSKLKGLWDATRDVDDLVVPPDLEKALLPVDEAKAYFMSAAPSYRRNVLRWLFLAKKPETRTARIDRIVAFCMRGERIPQL